GALKSNLLCFSAMVMWSFAFPIAEFLLVSWGTIALVLVRQLIAVSALFCCWLWIDGWVKICRADWYRGISVGGVGFGLGSMTFLIGQDLSDAVTPAIAASMMPIVGALLEVTFDGRRMQPRLLLGIVFALLGGLLATGTRMDEGNFGWGSLLCLVSVVLFAWGTRATTKSLHSLSFVGQTTITMSGSLCIVFSVYLVMLLLGIPGTAIGLLDTGHIVLLLFTSTASLALAQFMWIRSASGLGILLASLHMNAVPFYVMVIVVLFLGEGWNWWQAAGAALVAMGVLLAQSVSRGRGWR
ncbi:MAG: DMT family transporter, partial [Gammaproteobacteria bacterium]|nr:DMT family transporter [Gammaproteobacteria bacterium]